MLNNPIRYNDPSGHNADCGIGEPGCRAGVYTPPPDQSGSLDRVLASYGITTEGGRRKQKQDALLAAFLTGSKYTVVTDDTPANNFRNVHGDIHIVFGAHRGDCLTEGNVVTCGADDSHWLQTLIHEYGHVFDQRYRDLSHWDDQNPNCGAGGCMASNYLPDNLQYPSGYFCNDFPCLAHPPRIGNYNFTEAFADMYMNWVLDGRNANGLSYADTDQNGFDYGHGATRPDALRRNEWMWNSTINRQAPSGIPVFLWFMGLIR